MDVKTEQRKTTAAPTPTSPPRPAPPDKREDTTPEETPKERRARKAHRIRLYVYVIGALIVVAYLIALGTANTASVRVSWVFGTSSVPLVWLVLSAAVLGVVLGLLISLVIRWRTRRPHKRAGEKRTDGRTPGPPSGASDASPRPTTDADPR